MSAPQTREEVIRWLLSHAGALEAQAAEYRAAADAVRALAGSPIQVVALPEPVPVRPSFDPLTPDRRAVVEGTRPDPPAAVPARGTRRRRYWRVPEVVRAEIVRLRGAGWAVTAIAAQLDLHISTVQKILSPPSPTSAPTNG